MYAQTVINEGERRAPVEYEKRKGRQAGKTSQAAAYFKLTSHKSQVTMNDDGSITLCYRYVFSEWTGGWTRVRNRAFSFQAGCVNA